MLEGKHYDVIVAGGGSAGFCAAVQAARAGLSVALVEKYGMPGGTLTTLGNNSIDQFNNPHRKGDNRVIAGIGWEFSLALESRGYATIPDMNAPYEKHWQYGVKVNPVAAAQLMDDFLLDAGVDLYYNQSVADVETSIDGVFTRIEALIISTKAGLMRMTARMFIDCTGDGDVCAWAGAPFEVNDVLQPGTIRLYLDRSATDNETLSHADRLWQQALEEGSVHSDDLICGNFGAMFSALADNVNHIGGFNAADSDSKTRAEIEARRCMLRVMDALKRAGGRAAVSACAPEVAARESRRILGDIVITKDDYLNMRVFEDAVCYSYWFIDIHHLGQKAEIIYLRDERTPTIPMRAMIPKTLANVYVAGRCISSDRAANSAIRVKASCMAMGQACGAAAAIAIRENGAKTRGTDIQAIRELLKSHGAIVPGAE